MPSSAFQSCFLPLLPLCHQAMPKGRVPPRPGLLPTSWPQSTHLDMAGMLSHGSAPCEGRRRHLSLQGDYPEWGGHSGFSPHSRAKCCPMFELWSMVQHLPSLCGDSQASQNQSKMIFIWWVQDEGFFSPGPEFPSSWWFADSASIIITALIPTLPTRQLSPRRLHRDVADCKAQSQEYCTGILQITRFNLFFP